MHVADIISDIPGDWKIILPEGGMAESQATYAPPGNTAMIPWRVPRASVATAPQHITGYSYTAFDGEEFSLKRVLPQPHPFWPGLWGTRINVQGESGWDNAAPVTKAKEKGFYDAYDHYRVEVFYSGRDYDIRPDGEIEKEQDRYVEKLPGKPYVEQITIEGGQLRFPDGSAVPGPNAYRVGKSDYIWIWHEVPVTWALDGNGRATKIENCIGAVNSSPWEGFPAETLYLDNVDTEYVRATCSHRILGLPSYAPPRYLKITFKFKYFEKGWNTAPRVINPGVAGEGLVWEQITTVGGGKPYRLRDFDQLFQKAEAV